MLFCPVVVEVLLGNTVFAAKHHGDLDRRGRGLVHLGYRRCKEFLTIQQHTASLSRLSDSPISDEDVRINSVLLACELLIYTHRCLHAGGEAAARL